MKLSKRTLSILIGLILLNPLWMTHAVKVSDQVDDPNNDVFFTLTGNQFHTYTIPVSQTTVGIETYLRFDNLAIPVGASIQNATLSLRGSNGVHANETLLVTIYGLKQMDQYGAWTGQTDFIQSIPVSTAFSNVNVSGLQNEQWQNYTVTSIVQERVNEYNWNPLKNFGFKIVSVPQNSRWFYAYELNPSWSAKLYITYNEPTAPTVDDTFIENYEGYDIWNRTIAGGGKKTAQIYDLVANDYEMWNWEGLSAPTKYSGVLDAESPYGGLDVVAGETFMLATNTSDNTILNFYYSQDYGNTYSQTVEIVDSAGVMEWWSMSFDDARDMFHVVYELSNTYYCNVSLINSTWTRSTPYDTGMAGVGMLQTEYWDGNNTLFVASDRGTKARFLKTQIPATGPGGWLSTPNSAFDCDRALIKRVTNGDIIVCIYDGGADNDAWFYELDVAGSLWTGAGIYSFEHGETTTDRFWNMEVGKWYSHDALIQIGSDIVGGIYYPEINVRWDNGTWFTKRMNLSAGYDCPTNFGGAVYQSENDALRLLVDITGVGGGMYDLHPTLIDTPQYFSNLNPYQIESDNSELRILGLDVRQESGSLTYDFIVTDVNGTINNSTCIQQATTLEEIKACLDAITGGQPNNPDPPGSNYPVDGPGALTRFNIRFYIWIIGWICVFAPIARIARGGLGIEYYFGYAIMILTGIALVWSISTI